MYRHQGVVKVEVLRAENLAAADIGNKSDPLVELTTDNEHKVSTHHKSNTLHPVWNQTFYLLVQVGRRVTTNRVVCD